MKGVFRSIAVIGLMGLGLAACGTLKVDPFLDETVSGTDFTAYLAREYQRRVKVERDIDVEWNHAGRLARKGYAALDGVTVDPWVPSDWNVLPQDLGDLQDARARLMARLERGRITTPEPCAKAQVYYDGWLEQANDNDWGPGWQGPVQPDYVAAERAAFEEILPLCGAAPVQRETIAPLPLPSTEQRFTIYFEWNQNGLTSAATALIDSIVDFVQELGDATIALEGHTDTSGGDAYNAALSRRRAEQVREALEGSAVTVEDIEWFGESRPAVPTADGVREPLNRRVEVMVLRPNAAP